MRCLKRGHCSPRTGFSLLLAVLTCVLFTGCSSTPKRSATPGERQFNFHSDTFAFANELVWEYGYDDNGRWKGHPRDPKPDYSHHCFVVARSTAQFFEHARFAPDLTPVDESGYRTLIRKVIARSLRSSADWQQKVVIPGYADLKSFSLEHEQLLKSECGNFLQSYFQRGHWRMIFPFSRAHQGRMHDQLLNEIAAKRLPVVHVVQFPELTVNHAVVFFDARHQGRETKFFAYDPNEPDRPLVFTYDGRAKTFGMPRTLYFPGGAVDVYQSYHRWNY